MNNRTYLIPGLAGWTFKTSDTGSGLWSGLGTPGVAVTTDMSTTLIASRVQEILWLSFHMTGQEAEKASKVIFNVDWSAMISEAGTDVQHQSPNLPGWTLKISDLGSGLWYSNGAGIQLTADTSAQEIATGVQRVLQDILPQVEIDVQVDEFMRIDFKKLILNAWSDMPAPLLEGHTADNSVFANSICADVRRLAVLHANDGTAIADEICLLVKRLSE